MRVLFSTVKNQRSNQMHEKKSLHCSSVNGQSINHTFICAVVLSLLFIAVPDAHGADLHRYIVDSISDIQKHVAAWYRYGSLELSVTILIGVVGLVISGLQLVQAGWIKIVTAILGILSGGLLLVKQQCFDGDHRAYNLLATQVEQLVASFNRQFVRYDEPLSRNDYDFLCDALDKLQSKITSLQNAAFGKSGAPATTTKSTSFSLITSAYAEEMPDVPAWVNNVPTDADNIYFVGVANDRTPQAARDTAEQQAQRAIESSFETTLQSYSQVPAEDVVQLSHKISASKEVVSTFVIPEAGAYRGYALLRVPRALAVLAAKSFFVSHDLSFDPKLFEAAATNGATKQVAITQVRDQKRAADQGVVYVHVATPADRSLGTVLCQALGQLVSAPSVEVQVSQPANTVRYFTQGDIDLANKLKALTEQTLAAEGYSVALQAKDEYAEGYKTPKHEHQFEIWLAPIPRPRPRVNLKVETGTSAQQVEQLKKTLQNSGYDVPVTNLVEGVPTQEARVIYHKKSDAVEASALTKAAADAGLSGSLETPTFIKSPIASKPGEYELRVGKQSFGAEAISR